MAKQYLTDINAPEFADEAKEFVELPCAFGGNKEETMNALCSWAYSMEQNLPRQGMNIYIFVIEQAKDLTAGLR